MDDMNTVFLDILKTFIRQYWHIISLIIILNIIKRILVSLKPKLKGYLGEKLLITKLKSLPKDEYLLLNDIMLQNKKGTSQIDHILVSIYGVFVIETKNYTGWIYGNEHDKKWIQNIYGNKYYFQNPLHQNYGHIKALEELNSLFKKHIDFISIIAFSDNCELKFKIQNVTYFSKIVDLIKSYNKVIYTKSDISNIYNYINKKNITSYRARKNHVNNIKRKLKKAKDN